MPPDKYYILIVCENSKDFNDFMLPIPYEQRINKYYLHVFSSEDSVLQTGRSGIFDEIIFTERWFATRKPKKLIPLLQKAFWPYLKNRTEGTTVTLEDLRRLADVIK